MGKTYEVENILDHITDYMGVRRYLVKWVGYDLKRDHTWEPESNLCNCDEILDAYKVKADVVDKERQAAKDAQRAREDEYHPKSKHFKGEPHKREMKSNGAWSLDDYLVTKNQKIVFLDYKQDKHFGRNVDVLDDGPAKSLFKEDLLVFVYAELERNEMFLVRVSTHDELFCVSKSKIASTPAMAAFKQAKTRHELKKSKLSVKIAASEGRLTELFEDLVGQVAPESKDRLRTIRQMREDMDVIEAGITKKYHLQQTYDSANYISQSTTANKDFEKKHLDAYKKRVDNDGVNEVELRAQIPWYFAYFNDA